MINYIIITLIFFIAVVMTMVGKGGGNFYVMILALANVPMHQAATTGQFILFSASIAAMIIFQRNKTISWTLAIMIGSLTGISALGGGYFSHLFSEFSLKMIFAIMLAISGAIMLLPVSEKKYFNKRKKWWYFSFKIEDKTNFVNLWIVLPITILTGFTSGMVGVSGGSFLVPLMVLACGVSMHIAVGTASTLIAVTALMGFSGHAIQGDFNPFFAIPLAFVAIIGGIIGSKFSIKTKPLNLKKLFAYTNWIAAIFMVINAFYVKGLL